MKTKSKNTQTVTIVLPADPSRKAEVTFTPGPLMAEAERLAAEPGSGWERAASPIGGDPSFLVDRRLIVPKPLRKRRPDASARIGAYNAAKAKKAPAPQPQRPGEPAPAETLEEWQERKARERFAAPWPGKKQGFDF